MVITVLFKAINEIARKSISNKKEVSVQYKDLFVSLTEKLEYCLSKNNLIKD